MQPSNSVSTSEARQWKVADGEGTDERILATARLLLAGVFIVAVFLDPSIRPERAHSITFGPLFWYLTYSGLLFFVSQWRSRLSPITRAVVHGCDIGAAATVTLLTGGPSSPFFVLFGFVPLAAAFRWGLHGTLATGLLCASIYGIEAFFIAPGAGPAPFTLGGELNLFIVRVSYVILFAGVIGYLAEQEKRHRRQIAEMATSDERARLARELHDTVIQSLLGIRMRLTALRYQSTDAGMTHDLERLEDVLVREVANLRDLMSGLADSTFSSTNVAATIRDIADRFNHDTRFAVLCRTEGAIPPMPARVVTEVGRIVQEALVNARRHSGATQVRIVLAHEEGRCRLTIEDNGRGFDFDGGLSLPDLDQRGWGPRVIKDRVRCLSGALHIQSTPGTGARLEIDLPWVPTHA